MVSIFIRPQAMIVARLPACPPNTGRPRGPAFIRPGISAFIHRTLPPEAITSSSDIRYYYNAHQTFLLAKTLIFLSLHPNDGDPPPRGCYELWGLAESYAEG
jgi:hypothetical protein